MRRRPHNRFRGPSRNSGMADDSIPEAGERERSGNANGEAADEDADGRINRRLDRLVDFLATYLP